MKLTLLSIALSLSLASAGRSHFAHHRSLHTKDTIAKRTQFTTGDPDDHTSPGVILENKSGSSQDYYFYNNLENGDGWASPNFNDPLKYITMPAGEIAYVSLDTSFKGRVQRGTSLPATWVEFQVAASNDNGAHGDVSLEQGCDGAAEIFSTEDGNTSKGGFSNDCRTGAPSAAFQAGTNALASTMGNWNGPGNTAAIDWLNQVVGQDKAYITGGTGVPDVSSSNQRLWITFH